jgi:hypothetical protein
MNLYVEYGLTTKQINYLRYIVQYARDHKGNSPGIRETARQFESAPSTARDHILELSNRRLLRLEDGKIIVENATWEAPFLDDL